MSEHTEGGKAPQRGLHLPRLWYLLGAMLLLVVGVLSLLPMPNVGVGDKLSHLVTYFFSAAGLACWRLIGGFCAGRLLA